MERGLTIQSISKFFEKRWIIYLIKRIPSEGNKPKETSIIWETKISDISMHVPPRGERKTRLNLFKIERPKL